METETRFLKRSGGQFLVLAAFAIAWFTACHFEPAVSKSGQTVRYRFSDGMTLESSPEDGSTSLRDQNGSLIGMSPEVLREEVPPTKVHSSASVRDQMEKMFPLSMKAELERDSGKLVVSIQNIGKQDLILDQEAIKEIGITYAYNTKDRAFVDHGPQFGYTADDAITNRLVSRGLGQRFMILKPREILKVNRDLNPVFEELNKDRAVVNKRHRLSVQAYGSHISVGRFKDNAVEVDGKSGGTMALSNTVFIDSIAPPKSSR